MICICGAGFVRWSTENRSEKLWVPQNTLAEEETSIHQEYFGSENRFNSMIVQSQSDANVNANVNANVLTKENLMQAMKMHQKITSTVVTVDDTDYTFLDLCTPAGGSCISSFSGVCNCLVLSILKQWNYDLETLQNDEDYMTTLNQYGNGVEDLAAVLGNPTFDVDFDVSSDNNNNMTQTQIIAAEAFSVSYFVKDRSAAAEAGSDEAGSEADPINEAWELEAFLNTTQSASEKFSLDVNYLSGRSFGDEFGATISGDLLFVQVSYVVVFVFLGANLGKIKCGNDSRWTMSLAALFMVGLSTAASFAISSAFGLFYGPVHSLLPFILLGIGVDNAFVIVNAFNRERNIKRTDESNDQLADRSARALSRAGASITVTSATDLVAFGISASSSLPALASFCAYAAIGIFFLWFFASTFFTACLVLDERRQRDDRRECFCCLTRKNVNDQNKDDGFKEDIVSIYFRKYHAPIVLSKLGKSFILLVFGIMLGFGAYGAANLAVEDTQRNFIPKDSYLTDYIDAVDEFYPSSGIELMIVFQDSAQIYEKRDNLANLETRLTGLSTAPPYIAEPTSEATYRNLMSGYKSYLDDNGIASLGIDTSLGEDGWPTSESDFVISLQMYTSFMGPGAIYAQDVTFSEDGSNIEAMRVKSEYVSLMKTSRGKTIDDSDKQIQAMDETREMIESWGEDVPPAFTYSDKFISIEGFKRIR